MIRRAQGTRIQSTPHKEPMPAANSKAHQFTPFQRLLSSRFVTRLGMSVARALEPRAGYAIADTIAWLICSLRPHVYHIVMENLRHVVGTTTNERELRSLVCRTFKLNARNNYDLWHIVHQGPEAIRAAVDIPSEAWRHLDRARARGTGVIIAGTHTGNFELAICALAAHGLDAQVLGIATHPAGGFDLMDRMLAKAGVNLTAISLSSLRQAVRRLKRGGTVLTGVDRPVGDHTPDVEFFGRPSLLPTGHIRLAMRTGATIVVASPYRDQQGMHHVTISPAIEMSRHKSPHRRFVESLRLATRPLEFNISARPSQWAVFVPVWTELA
jgi:lauroyl/myristoyl acyltransferase